MIKYCRQLVSSWMFLSLLITIQSHPLRSSSRHHSSPSIDHLDVCDPAVEGAWLPRHDPLAPVPGTVPGTSAESIANYDCSRFPIASFLPTDLIGYTHVMPLCERLDHQPTVQSVPLSNLKLVWRSKCNRYSRFDGVEFSQLLAGGRTLYIIGDSTTEEMWISLVCMLGKEVVDDAATALGVETFERYAFETWGLTKNKLMRKVGMLHIRGGGRIVFVRSNYLTSQRTGNIEEDLVEVPKQFGDITYVEEEIPWTYFLNRDKNEGEFDTLLFNTGSHYKSSEKLNASAALFLQWIAKHVPLMNVWYRTNVPGSIECEFKFKGEANNKLNSSSSSGSSDSDSSSGPTTWNWDKFKKWDQIWKREAEKYFPLIKVLDVRQMSMGRSDAHPGLVFGKVDCLHMCLPGPVDEWNNLLYNELLRWKK